jgi:hypothetical protein
LAYPFGREIVADDLTVHLLIPNSPGNQLSVLRAEIENKDSLVPNLGHTGVPGK